MKIRSTKKMKMTPHRIARIDKFITSRVKMRGSGVLDKVVDFAKNVDINDPKTKIAIAAAPFLGKALLNAGLAGYNALNNAFGKKIHSDFVPSLPGESNTHLPGYNFVGPGSDAERRLKLGIKPVNNTDSAAMEHDLEYGAIQRQYKSGKITREQADKLTRLSDEKLKRNFALARKNAPIGEKVLNNLAHTAISAKNLGENLGVISPGKFVGYGKPAPLKSLKKKALKIAHKKKHKKANLNTVLSKVAAHLMLQGHGRKKMRGGNLKNVTDSIGNFFNHTIPDTFTKTIPAPFISAYNDTKSGLKKAYDVTLGY